MVLNVFRRARDPVQDRFGLTGVSPRVADALAVLERERAALAEQVAELEALADRDPLTGTLNRRGFMRELHRSISVVERHNRSAAVLFIDLDGFKGINDGYGHAAGDAVLRALGRRLTDLVRESDVVGRLGGDEFGIILNDVTPDEAARKSEALALAIADTRIDVHGVLHSVRASIGMHVVSLPEDPEIALARADEAMYVDKHARKRQAEAFAGF